MVAYAGYSLVTRVVNGVAQPGVRCRLSMCPASPIDTKTLQVKDSTSTGLKVRQTSLSRARRSVTFNTRNRLPRPVTFAPLGFKRAGFALKWFVRAHALGSVTRISMGFLVVCSCDPGW